MRSPWNDVRFGMRILVRRPIFAATVILVLGVGIGGNMLVFSVVDAVLLRPLPYPNPNQLVWISQGISPTNEEHSLAPDFLVWQSRIQSFSHVAAFSEQYRNLTGGNEPERILTAQVSAEFFPLLGIQPVIGRNFLTEEDRPGNRRVAILTHGLWMRRFGAKPSIGEIIKLDDELFEVVGILPQSFRFPEPLDVEVFTPLALGDEQASRKTAAKTGVRMVKVIARLKPGVTLAQARAELNIVQQAIVRAYPLQDGKETKLRPLHEYLTADIERTLLILLGAVGLLWLLGCLNVGNFLLARATSRRSEMAVRLALGATRMQLFGQLLMENAGLTFLGCSSGLLMAVWGHDLLVSILPHRVFGITETHLDAGMVGFVIISFLLTTLLVSFVAAGTFPLQNVADFLKSGAASVIGSFRLRRLLNGIVVGELALAVLLLVAAGLMIRSFWALRYRNLGFESDRVLTLRIDLPLAGYPGHNRQAAFFETLLQRVALLPGVDTVALCTSTPPIPVASLFRVSIEGQPSSQTVPVMMARPQAVSSEYLAAMHIPLVEGRMFSDRDQEGTPPVVVVNRAFIRQYLANERAVGKRIRLGGSKAPWRTIIGVVEDFKNVGLAVGPEPEVYYPYRQFPWLPSMYLIVRASMDDPLKLVPATRAEMSALDAELPIAEVQTLDQRLTASVAQPRFTMVLLTGFASLALLLAVVGVYSVMLFATQQRTRGIAIRMALGAQKKQVVWMIVREGLLLSLVGASIGTGGALAAGRLLSSLLYGVTPSDPYTLIIVLALLIFTAMGGCYYPAYRAAKVDPIEILRYE